MDTLLQDLRFAGRSLVRHPGFALTALITLALGIGATTAIFSVVNAVLLRPLPFAEPDRMVTINNFWTRSGTRATTVSLPDFRDWEAQARSFTAIASYRGGPGSVTLADSADYAGVFIVSPGFFDALGARASLGRLLASAEFQPGAPPAVVITDAFWRRKFNGAAAAVGSTVKYADRLFTIAGVLEPGARLPFAADIYVPSWIFPDTGSRSAHNYFTVARLHEGVTVAQAHAEMRGIL